MMCNLSQQRSQEESAKRPHMPEKFSVKFNPEIETLCQGIEFPLSEKETMEVPHLLWKNQDAFKTESTKLGRANQIKHGIQATTEQPI